MFYQNKPQEILRCKSKVLHETHSDFNKRKTQTLYGFYSGYEVD